MKRFADYCQKILPSLAVTVLIWLALEIPYCFGFRPAILWPFYFLSGALAGLTGRSWFGVIGGAIGRAVIFVFFEKIIYTLFFSKKPLKERFADSWQVLKERLLHLIPGLKSLQKLITSDFRILGMECLSAAIAVLLSYWLSGNGRLVNSFGGIALAVMIMEEIATHKGFIYNIFEKFSVKLNINASDRLMKAHALGYTLGTILQGKTIMLAASGLLALAGIVMIIIPKVNQGKNNRDQIETE